MIPICPSCDKPLCPWCGRCPGAGHTPECASPEAEEARRWIAALNAAPLERAVGAPETLLELIMREARR